MNYLLSFAPWLVFATVSAASFCFGALAGFLAAAIVMVQAHRRGPPPLSRHRARRYANRPRPDH